MQEQSKRIPVIYNWARQIYWRLKGKRSLEPEVFAGSSQYWEHRYASGGNSGVGSYDAFASFKAEVLNAFVAKYNVADIIEFGCGDGNQLSLASYPKYIGFDVSAKAIALCKKKFFFDRSKTFKQLREYDGEKANLSLSLDVIFHLVEDEVLEHHMNLLFTAAERFVIIYASDFEEDRQQYEAHVRHRKFTKWIRENVSGWKRIDHILNRYPYMGDYKTGSFAEFHIYEKR